MPYQNGVGRVICGYRIADVLRERWKSDVGRPTKIQRKCVDFGFTSDIRPLASDLLLALLSDPQAVRLTRILLRLALLFISLGVFLWKLRVLTLKGC